MSHKLKGDLLNFQLSGPRELGVDLALQPTWNPILQMNAEELFHVEIPKIIWPATLFGAEHA